ncbi:SMI1/KNR4 family protein [Singulisphaera sp. Ch08]|uniref:SMI1/KNR4 family protein n=1 Tax=Singulisphaera sp. Ch08 TaxID=3120278 RepID=A0AAU7CJZ7_9BACT
MDNSQKLMESFAREVVRIWAAWPLVGVRGFREDEIRAVEEAISLPLPAAYRAFLRTMGRSAGALFGDVTMTFDSPGAFLHLQHDARDNTAGLGYPPRLTPEAFVFSDYGGSQFSFFLCGGREDDPEIFDYEVGNIDPPQSAGRFTDTIRYHLKAYPRRSKPFLWWS